MIESPWLRRMLTYIIIAREENKRDEVVRAQYHFQEHILYDLTSSNRSHLLKSPPPSHTIIKSDQYFARWTFGVI
jgi:hypothetical protein